MNELRITVGKDSNGRMFVLTSEGFAASFVGGLWIPKMLFTGYELAEYFTNIKDPSERIAIYEEARRALECENPLQ